MRRTSRHALIAALAVAAAAFAAVALAAVIRQPGLLAQQPGMAGILLGVGLLLGLSGLSAAFIVSDRHFDDLDRLRLDLLTAALSGRLPSRHTQPLTGEVERVAQAAAAALQEREVETEQIRLRLQAVVAAAGEAVIVVTDTGLVSLLNAAVRRVPTVSRLEVGMSIYGAFDRDGLLEAMHRPHAAGRPFAARLRTVEGAELPVRIYELAGHAGMIFFIPADSADEEPVVLHDLSLHDRPPLAAAAAATRLEELPIVALDLETTGLDPRQDRVVAAGAVRMHGVRIYRHLTLDRLVNPGRPVPRAAVRVHGITTAMLAGAPRFPDVWPEIEALIRGVVVIGHNIGFDLTLLACEAERAGIAWPDPPSLDTALLAAAVEPQMSDLNLEAVAQRFGIAVEGRHTALGDALLSAEIFIRMVPRLRECGICTAGEASSFAARGRRLGRLQRAAGWRPTGVP